MKTLLLACLLAIPALPQIETTPPPQPKFYKLDFAVKELDAGKLSGSRNYTTMISLNEKSEIRMGEKVPVPARDNSGGFTYLDVGVFLQCTLIQTYENNILISVNADITAVTAQTNVAPVVRTVRWASRATVPLRKATTLYTSDGAADKKQMQLELTATPIL